VSDFSIDIDDFNVRESLDDLADDWSDAGGFVVGTNVRYAVHIEFGRGPIEAQDADALRFENEDGDVIYRTRVSGHPPYPFFRPAVRELRANPEAFILKNTQLDAVDGIRSADEAVEIVARALESQIKRNATANAPNRSPGTDPEHPKVQTGNLRASVQAVRVS
jgi:hypothetical protein